MFKVGDKVVCIKPSISLVKNEMYTIKSIKADGGLKLEEVIPKTFNCDGFKPERFRRVDYDFADSVLAKLTEEFELEVTKENRRTL